MMIKKELKKNQKKKIDIEHQSTTSNLKSYSLQNFPEKTFQKSIFTSTKRVKVSTSRKKNEDHFGIDKFGKEREEEEQERTTVRQNLHHIQEGFVVKQREQSEISPRVYFFKEKAPPFERRKSEGTEAILSKIKNAMKDYGPSATQKRKQKQKNLFMNCENDLVLSHETVYGDIIQFPSLRKKILHGKDMVKRKNQNLPKIEVQKSKYSEEKNQKQRQKEQGQEKEKEIEKGIEKGDKMKKEKKKKIQGKKYTKKEQKKIEKKNTSITIKDLKEESLTKWQTNKKFIGKQFFYQEESSESLELEC